MSERDRLIVFILDHPELIDQLEQIAAIVEGNNKYSEV